MRVQLASMVWAVSRLRGVELCISEVDQVGVGTSAVQVTTLADTHFDVERFSGARANRSGWSEAAWSTARYSLLAGEPGIGKSTLVLQLIDGLVRSGHSALLITGEESIGQVALRATRLGVSRERFRAAATYITRQCGCALAISEDPDVLVVDSVQALENPDLDQSPGSLIQVRECAAALVRYAKSKGTCVILVGHVTEGGAVAGPEHR